MIECDVQCYGAERDSYEVMLGCELNLNDDQIEKFNKEHENVAHIQWQRGKRGVVAPYLYLFKVYPEEDPTENAGPFESREEAQKFLTLAWKAAGKEGVPMFQETER